MKAMSFPSGESAGRPLASQAAEARGPGRLRDRTGKCCPVARLLPAPQHDHSMRRSGDVAANTRVPGLGEIGWAFHQAVLPERMPSAVVADLQKQDALAVRRYAGRIDEHSSSVKNCGLPPPTGIDATCRMPKAASGSGLSSEVYRICLPSV